MKSILYNLLVAYFGFFARNQLRKYPHATIIGVTGSWGKTSLRLALVHILKHRGRVKHSVHANSEIGLPLNILGLSPGSLTALDWFRLIVLAPIRLLTFREHFDYYVVEMGIDSPVAPKNMSTLLKLIHPHVGVVLSAGLNHAAAFDHLVRDKNPERRRLKLVNLIAKEKMLLVKSLNKQEIAVVNLDQKELARELRDVVARQVTFGRVAKSDVRILDDFTFRYLGQDYHLTPHDYFPPSFASTFAAAIAVAASLGIPPSLSVPHLSDYRSPAGRLRLFAGIKGSKIIDSSYNASPSTMLDALIVLKKLGGRGKKIAVLGDMRELGESTRLSHKNLADQIIKFCDEAILFGPSTLEFTYPVLRAKKFPVHHFNDMKSLIRYLTSVVTAKSHILVKGSQNSLFMERATEAILADKAGTSLLCRRGAYWDKLRRRTP